MFFKKRNQPASEQPPGTQAEGFSEVYVMPEKYQVRGKSKGGAKLLIASVILIAVIAVTGGYLLYDMANQQPAISAPAYVPPVIEVPAPIIEPEIQVIIPTSTLSDMAVVSSTSGAASTTETKTGVLPISLDSDNDGLTDLEEVVFGTLPTNPDTDGDNYKDGVEVAGGYTPTKAGSAKLNESPFVLSLTTNFEADNFQLLYPKDWQASLVQNNKQVIITASTGEIIRVTVQDNQTKSSVLAWYLQDHPETPVSSLKLVSTWDGELSGIYSADGQNAYLTNGDKTKLYAIEYISPRQSEFRYPAVFGMIIKSLRYSAPVVTPPPAAPITATPTPETVPLSESSTEGF